MPYDQDENQKKESDSYAFLQETIKPKPVSRKKIMQQLVRIAVYGLIFGGFACCGFFLLKPWAQSRFQGSTKTVTIPKDENTETGQKEEAAPEEQTEVLTAEQYRQLMGKLYEIAKEADKSIVSIQASVKDDWTGTANPTSAAGVIAADNGHELLILADDSVCKDGEEWTVQFADQSEYKASLKKQDGNYGLAVFAVDRDSIGNTTWAAIKTASLGNSNLSKKGDMVIALGNMFGYGDGMAYGVISSVKYDAMFADGDCTVLATDIPASSGGTGFLVNGDGDVIGLIRQGLLQETEAVSNALAISDLKPLMELLLNGESVPYIGVDGATVTGAAIREQSVPEGVYVTQVRADSPAMKAGIQSGDIIQQVGSTKVSGLTAYRNAVQNLKDGEVVQIKGQRRGTGGYVDITFTVTAGSLE